MKPQEEKSHFARTMEFYTREGNKKILFPAVMEVDNWEDWVTRPRDTNAEEAVHRGDVRLARILNLPHTHTCAC